MWLQTTSHLSPSAQGYNYEVKYRPEAKMVLADTISCQPHPVNNGYILMNERIDGIETEFEDPERHTISIKNFHRKNKVLCATKWLITQNSVRQGTSSCKDGQKTLRTWPKIHTQTGPLETTSPRVDPWYKQCKLSDTITCSTPRHRKKQTCKCLLGKG